jgi:general stress protein 13
MSDKFKVGDVVQGKVSSVKPYGAFVALDETHTGLVHISQVAHAYIKDINEHLKAGDEVSVKVISIDEATGKISLSIRDTMPEPEKKEYTPREQRNDRPARTFTKKEEKTEGFNTLEDKLKEWMKHSQEIQHELNKRSNR